MVVWVSRPPLSVGRRGSATIDSGAFATPYDGMFGAPHESRSYGFVVLAKGVFGGLLPRPTPRCKVTIIDQWPYSGSAPGTNFCLDRPDFNCTPDFSCTPKERAVERRMGYSPLLDDGRAANQRT
jgi:hypothetical protein